jgi:hypothetical protein
MTPSRVTKAVTMSFTKLILHGGVTGRAPQADWIR